MQTLFDDPPARRTPTRYHDPAHRLTLYHEDCLIGMHESLAAGKDYGTYDDTIPRETYLDGIEDWGHEATRVLADDGSLFLNMGGIPISPWGPHEVLDRLRPLFVLQNEIIIVKSVAIDAEHVERSLGIRQPLAMGHFRPLNASPRYLSSCHEYVFHLTKRGDVEIDKDAVGVPSNITRWASGRDRRDRGTVWFLPYPTIQAHDDRRHPASFPVALPRQCIQLHGVSRTRLVLDPFCGIGTTAVACRELDVGFVGFEIDPGYFDTAVKRLTELDQAEPQLGLFGDD